MDENRVLFDASAYMLFEASGDSESQHFDGALEPDSDAAVASVAAEDDAQSCSYGSVSDCSRMRKVDPGEDDFRGADFDDNSGEEEDDGGGWSVDEEDDGVVDQCCRRGNAAPAAIAAVKEKPKKSKVCEDSNLKMVNEREGDRLFWEACLAS